ncbi:MAG: hypothetical protein ACXQTL_06005 [Methanosarcinales archaeon]
MADLVKYHGVAATISIKSSSGTLYDVGVTQSFEFSPSFEISELWGQNSILRQDVVRYQAGADVSISYAAFDGDVLGKILGSSSTGEDVDGNAQAGRLHHSIADDEEVELFEIRGTVSRGGNYFRFKAEDVVFPGFTLSIPRDDFVMPSLSGRAKNFHLEFAGSTVP